jgi:hypothetical protein
MEDYQRLRREEEGARLERWRAWLARADALADEILQRRQGEPIDVDALISQDREDLESRDDWVIGKA